jgi:hypothetical protein
VSIFDRLARLDDKMGMSSGPKPGESRRDYLARVGRARWTGYVPNSVLLELVALHDRVTELEKSVQELKERR